MKHIIIKFSFLYFLAVSCFLTAAPEENLTRLHEREFNAPSTLAEDILLFPFYVPEYILRVVSYPLKWFFEFSDDVQLAHRAIDFFSNKEKTAYGFPYVLFLTGEGVGFGATYHHSNLFHKERRLSLNVNYFLNDDYSASASYTRKPNLESPLFYKFLVEADQNENKGFYGIGNSSALNDKSIYNLKVLTSKLDFGWKFPSLKYVRLSAHVGIENFFTTTGSHDDNRPSVEAHFDSATIEGFGRGLNYLEAGLELQYDSQNLKGNPSRGGFAQFKYTRFEPLGDNSYPFNRFELNLKQLVDLYHDQRVLALRLHYEAVQNGGEKYPFYLLPQLGGSNNLRGFEGGRFRDKQAVLASLEYRYTILKLYFPEEAQTIGLLFAETGRVMSTLDQLDDGGLRYSFGAGIMASLADTFLFRTQIGFGGEGVHFILSARQAF